MRYDLSESREVLSDILGFEDQVRGFDMETATDDNLDFLDIYAEFLGEEYHRMKDSYQKAVATMSELFMLENERAKMQAPISYEELADMFGGDIIERASAVHETYVVQQGKSREKYMARMSLEFKQDTSLTKADLDLLDAFLEHRRWFRAKTKALFRDWERDRRDLRERTVRLIEEEVEETKQRIQRELELFKQESKQAKKHAKLEDKRKDYEEKMRVIREIEEDKRRHEEEEKE